MVSENPREEIKKIIKKLSSFPHDQHTCIDTQMHTTTGMFSPTYRVQEIKPNVFVCFILAAFQVFKILAHILN